MALINNNFNILPWYTSLAHQDYKKWYAFGEKWPLIVPTQKLVPFQFVISKTGITKIESIKLVSLETSSSIDTSVTPMSIENADKGYTVIMAPPSICDLSVTTPEGLYYLELVVDDVTYYSDVFSYTSDLSECLKITYWNTDTLFYNGGEINFANDFKYELYIRATIGKPAYEFEEELTTRLGYKFLESQISNKLYRFNFLAPEYICDAMRLIRLSDYIHIESALGPYNAISFSYEPTWEEQGNLASVAVEFTTDTIIQKLPSFNRNQRENFYNALLSSTGEPVLFDEDVVAQYYSSYEDAIKGKLVRDLSEADVSEISPAATTIVDLGSGAAMRVNLLKLFAKFGSASSGVDTAAFNELVARVNQLKTRADGLQTDIQDVQDDVTTILNDYISKSVEDKQEIVSPLYIKNTLTMNTLYLPNENNEPSSYELKVGALGAGADTPEGGGSGGIGKVSIYLGAGTTPYDSDAEGKVVLPPYPTAITESTVSGWGFTKNTGTYIKPLTGIPKTDLESAVQTSLGKADTALQEHQDITHLATKIALQAVADDVKALNDILGIAEEADDVINSWSEVVAFLDGYGKSDDLADILSGMNSSIATNTTDITNLKTRADGLQTDIQEVQDDVAAILNDYLSKANGGIIKGAVTIQAALKMNTLYLPNSNNTPSDYTLSVGTLGSGADTPEGGGGGIAQVTINVNGSPYKTNANGVVTLPNYPTSLPASDVYDWAKKSSLSDALNELTVGTAAPALTDYYIAENAGGGTKYYRRPISKLIETIQNNINLDWSKITSGKPTTLSGYGITDALPLSGGTRTITSTDNTVLILKTDGWHSLINLQNNHGNSISVGYYSGRGAQLSNGSNYLSVGDDGVPYFNTNTLIHSGNIGSQSVHSATRLQDNNGALVYNSGNTFYVGDNIYPTIPTHILGKSISLRYGANASYGLTLNNSGNIQIGATANNDARLYVNSDNYNILHLHRNLGSGYGTAVYCSNNDGFLGMFGFNQEDDFVVVNGGYASTSALFRVSSNTITLNTKANLNDAALIYKGTSSVATLHITNVTSSIDYSHIFVSNADSSRKDRPLVVQNGYGNVLIGTTTDNGYKLYVGGNLASKGTANILDASTDTRLTLYMYQDIGRIYAYNSTNKTDHDLWIGGAADGKALTVKANGNVLIGTATDNGAKLQVNGTGEILNLINSSGGDSGIRFSRGAKTSWSIIDSGGNLYFIENTSQSTRMMLCENSQGGHIAIAGNITSSGNISASGYQLPTSAPSNPVSGGYYLYVGTLGAGATIS